MAIRFSILLSFFLLIACSVFSQKRNGFLRPNIILILTDDQGYGDLGYHQNPYVSTPVIDKFAAESFRFNNFYVSPVCSPTRASLLTGRYNIRTGVFDTFSGGSIMSSNETTLAEIFKGAGYETGQIGKWHLGDAYPSRPQDQGFSTSVWNMGGGIGSEGDIYNYYKGDSSYFNPVLWRDGEIYQSKGYCTDVFTDEALKFINKEKTAPFFLYLAYNAPHKPLQLPESYYNIYKGKEVGPAAFREKGFYSSDMSQKDKEDARKVYGMVTNIDDNVGRILATLKDKHLDTNTIVIFMTDNGPAQNRFTGGYRGKKSLVSEGGIHVPFFIRVPGYRGAKKDVGQVAAHIDILPTLAEMCHIDLPKNLKIDGRSLLPYIDGTAKEPLRRSLFFEWQRGYPEKYKNMAVIADGFKLIGNVGENAAITEFELFNLKKDPFETENLVKSEQALAENLKNKMSVWFDDIMRSPNLIDLPRINLGSSSQPSVILNRNDARGIQEIRDQEDIHVSWDVEVEHAGYYKVNTHFVNPLKESGKLYFRIGRKNITMENVATGVDALVMDRIFLEAGKFTIDSWYSISTTSYLTPFYLEINKLGEELKN